jgi:hypothetical protein
MSNDGNLPGGFGPPPPENDAPPAGFGPPPGGYGPPPGGYGAPASPQAQRPGPGSPAPPQPPYQQPPLPYDNASRGEPVAANGVPYKKIGLPILGVGFIALRLLLVCGRAASSSSSSYTPSYNQPDFSHLYKPGAELAQASALAAKKSQVARNLLAASQETGDVYWCSGSTIHHRTAAGKEDMYPTGMNVTQMSAFGERLCWAAEATDENHVFCAKGNALKDAKALVDTNATIAALTSSATYVYALETPPSDGILTRPPTNQITSVDLKTGAIKEVVRATMGTSFTFGNGFAYWITPLAPGLSTSTLQRARLNDGVTQQVAKLESTPDLLVLDGTDILMSVPGEDGNFGSIRKVSAAGDALANIAIPDEISADAMLTGDVLPDQLLPMRTAILARYGNQLARLARTTKPIAAQKLPEDVVNVALTKGGIVYSVKDSSVPIFMALN